MPFSQNDFTLMLQKQFDFVCGCSHCTREGFELSHALLGPEGGGSERLLQARGYIPLHAVTYRCMAVVSQVQLPRRDRRLRLELPAVGGVDESHGR